MAQDLRSFLALLEEHHDLMRIRREVDPRFEIASVMKRSADQDGPALYFERVRGSSLPLVANVVASRRKLALAMRTGVEGMLEAYRTRLRNPIPPRRVERTGQPEKLASLAQLPAITAHELDAGPYITCGVLLSAHPETGRVNLSFQRMCPISASEAAIYITGTGDLARHARAAGGSTLPVVIAIGLHPAFMLVAASRFPPEIDEAGIVGGLLGEPVRLAADAGGRWLVPEAAEIVLEGTIDFGRTVPEGPFGEYPGYYGAGSIKPKPAPVITFHSMTCRRDPVYQTVITGPTTGYDSTYFSLLSKEAMLYTVLSAEFPEVCAVNVLLSRYITVVQVNGGLSDERALALMGTAIENLIHIKFLVLVDSDVDVADPLDVLWALSTRVDPGRHMHVFRDMPMEPQDPSTPGRCDKIAFDARKPAGEAGEGFLRTRIPGAGDVRLEDYFERLSG